MLEGGKVHRACVAHLITLQKDQLVPIPGGGVAVAHAPDLGGEHLRPHLAPPQPYGRVSGHIGQWGISEAAMTTNLLYYKNPPLHPVRRY